jgi:DNA-binding transcriptional LysR family regulator
MGIHVLVEQNLKDGLLIAPLPRSHVLTDAYYLVRPRDRPAKPALRKFRNWVRTQLDVTK